MGTWREEGWKAWLAGGRSRFEVGGRPLSGQACVVAGGRPDGLLHGYLEPGRRLTKHGLMPVSKSHTPSHPDASEPALTGPAGR